MLQRLKQLDAGALGQLPRTMDFRPWIYSKFLWDKNGHGTTMAALTDDQPGGMHHVATRCCTGEQSLVDFVVECANGTVNACITVKVEVLQSQHIITHILVQIVAAPHADRNIVVPKATLPPVTH
jgi:hypothetical protein